MNAKLAKQIRRKARKAAEEAGIQSDTTYNVVPNSVKLEGAFKTLVARDMSTKQIEKYDEKRDFRRAERAGVLQNYFLQDVFGFNLVKPQVVLGQCLRGVVQRIKRALR